MSQVISCALYHHEPTETGLNLVAWLAFCYWVVGGYYDSLVQLRDATEEFTPAYTAVFRLARLFYRSSERRARFQAMEKEERKQVCRKYGGLRNKLQSPQTALWEKWWIAFPVLLDDLSQSMCWFIYTNLTFTAYNLGVLFRAVMDEQIESSPLKEPNFGQVMPLAMPLVIILAVFEASGST